MEYKKFGLIALMALLVILVMPAALGVLSLNMTQGDTLTGIIDVGVATTTLGFWGNVTLYGKATNTINTSFGIVAANITADDGCVDLTANISDCNITWNTNVSGTTEDSNLWEFYITALNSSGGSSETSATVTGVIIDNTNPIVPTAITPATGTILEPANRQLSITGTIDATLATGCIVQFYGTIPNAKSRYATQLDGTDTTCTITIDKFPEGTFKYTYWATDDTDIMAFTGGKRTFSVDYPSGAGKSVYFQQQGIVTDEEQQQKNKQTLAVIIVVIVIAVIIKKNKKRGK